MWWKHTILNGIVNIDTDIYAVLQVPSRVSHVDFWRRYFYKLHQIDVDQARKEALMRRAEVSRADDSISWDGKILFCWGFGEDGGGGGEDVYMRSKTSRFVNLSSNTQACNPVLCALTVRIPTVKILWLQWLGFKCGPASESQNPTVRMWSLQWP